MGIRVKSHKRGGHLVKAYTKGGSSKLIRKASKTKTTFGDVMLASAGIGGKRSMDRVALDRQYNNIHRLARKNIKGQASKKGWDKKTTRKKIIAANKKIYADKQKYTD